ncbi:hypothetical protein DBR17_19790 [Sphingomonas sp. HMWF008]|nr:hypothetical protein DBR17_19790 [Sphingomonas sp. HMWF008]
MKTNPYQWFADGDDLRDVTEGAYRPLPIPAVFGNAEGLDFSRLIRSIVPVDATPSVPALRDVHDTGALLLTHVLEAPVEPGQSLRPLAESAPESDAVTPLLAQPSPPALLVPAAALTDPSNDTPSTPVVADGPPHHLLFDPRPEHGFLQSLPAIDVMSAPPLYQAEPVAGIGGGTGAQVGLPYEGISDGVADGHDPLALLPESDDAGRALSSGLFVIDLAVLPDLGGAQVVAVLPDPIVDLGPLV